ncbi:hypothetical protein R3P38DRAFT_2766003 [Favolaschia claudopus]|uniref:Uncharacterized protein n=1 Tax=Favolaschia claudopus TaxID=2862362 RepID=A0AAW0D0J0_9AGAR
MKGRAGNEAAADAGSYTADGERANRAMKLACRRRVGDAHRGSLGDLACQGIGHLMRAARARRIVCRSSPPQDAVAAGCWIAPTTGTEELKAESNGMGIETVGVVDSFWDRASETNSGFCSTPCFHFRYKGDLMHHEPLGTAHAPSSRWSRRGVTTSTARMKSRNSEKTGRVLSMSRLMTCRMPLTIAKPTRVTRGIERAEEAALASSFISGGGRSSIGRWYMLLGVLLVCGSRIHRTASLHSSGQREKREAFHAVGPFFSPLRWSLYGVSWRAERGGRAQEGGSEAGKSDFEQAACERYIKAEEKAATRLSPQRVALDFRDDRLYATADSD